MQMSAGCVNRHLFNTFATTTLWGDDAFSSFRLLTRGQGNKWMPLYICKNKNTVVVEVNSPKSLKEINQLAHQVLIPVSQNTHIVQPKWNMDFVFPNLIQTFMFVNSFPLSTVGKNWRVSWNSKGKDTSVTAFQLLKSSRSKFQLLLKDNAQNFDVKHPPAPPVSGFILGYMIICSPKNKDMQHHLRCLKPQLTTDEKCGIVF